MARQLRSHLGFAGGGVGWCGKWRVRQDPDGQAHFSSAVSALQPHTETPATPRPSAHAGPGAEGHSPADEPSRHGRPGDAAGVAMLGLHRTALQGAAHTHQVSREEDEVQAQPDGGHQPQEQQRLRRERPGVSTRSRGWQGCREAPCPPAGRGVGGRGAQVWVGEDTRQVVEGGTAQAWPPGPGLTHLDAGADQALSDGCSELLKTQGRNHPQTVRSVGSAPCD